MPNQKIVIFDGVCNLCNGAVNFIIRRDPRARFRFAPSQSRAGQALLERHGIQELADETLVLVEGDDFKTRTDAVFAIAAELRWPWPVFTVFRHLPREFRDYFYRVVARHRYRLFGKRDTCRVPGLDVKSRFLE